MLGWALWLAACHVSRQSTDEQLLEIFAGFEFAGVENLPPPLENESMPEVDFTHGFEAKPFPKKVEVGRIYVFHNKERVDPTWLALHHFPRKLVAIGATLTKYPTSEDDLISSFEGGAHFRIDFEIEGLKGSIESLGTHDIIWIDESDYWLKGDYTLALRE